MTLFTRRHYLWAINFIKKVMYTSIFAEGYSRRQRLKLLADNLKDEFANDNPNFNETKWDGEADRLIASIKNEDDDGW